MIGTMTFSNHFKLIPLLNHLYRGAKIEPRVLKFLQGC